MILNSSVIPQCARFTKLLVDESHSIATKRFVLERHDPGLGPIQLIPNQVSLLVASNGSDLSVCLHMWKHKAHTDLKQHQTALCWPADEHRMNAMSACTSGLCCPTV